MHRYVIRQDHTNRSCAKQDFCNFHLIIGNFLWKQWNSAESSMKCQVQFDVRSLVLF